MTLPSPVYATRMAGSFVLGDVTYAGTTGHVALVQEYEGDPPYLDLEIATEDGGERETPRLVIDRLHLKAADWPALEGTRHAIPDPDEDDEQDQNLFWGSHFENVLELVLAFGEVDGDVVPITVHGVAMRATDKDDVEEAVPFTITAECVVQRPPPPIATAVPPAGPKTCHACGAVSSDLTERCLSCDAAYWWKPA